MTTLTSIGTITAVTAALFFAAPSARADEENYLVYLPDSYSSIEFTKDVRLPTIAIQFYSVEVEEFYSLWVDGERYDSFSVHPDYGDEQRFTWRVGFGTHSFYAKDSDGNVAALPGQPLGYVSIYHADFTIRAVTNPFSVERDHATALRLCYDISPNVPSFGWATEAPGRASFVRTNIYRFSAPRHPYDGEQPYRSFGATLMEDGSCEIVERWDGTNDYGAIGDGSGRLDSYYTVQAAIRFGPDRHQSYDYLKAIDKILIAPP